MMIPKFNSKETSPVRLLIDSVLGNQDPRPSWVFMFFDMRTGTADLTAKTARKYFIFSFLIFILATSSGCVGGSEKWNRELDVREQELLKQRRSATSVNEINQTDERIDMLGHKNGIFIPHDGENQTEFRKPAFDEERERAVNDSIDRELEALNRKK